MRYDGLDIAKALKDIPGLTDKLGSLDKDPIVDTPVLSAKIKLLWHCNLSCLFCELPKARLPMPKTDVERILSALPNLRKVHFSGGEVFLHPEIFSILEYACRSGIQVNLTSNGTLLDKREIKRLAEIGVHSVSLSLDGIDPGLHDKLRGKKGAHKAVMKSIEYFAQNWKKRPKLRINTVVSQLNIHELDGIHSFLRQWDREISWKLLPVDSNKKKLLLTSNDIELLSKKIPDWELLENKDFERERFTRYSDRISKGQYGFGFYSCRLCYMPWLHVFIEPEGFVYPCCMTHKRIKAVGNMYQTPLETILSGANLQEIKMNMATGNKLGPCANCDDFIEENTAIHRLLNHCSER